MITIEREMLHYKLRKWRYRCVTVPLLLIARSIKYENDGRYSRFSSLLGELLETAYSRLGYSGIGCRIFSARE
jgi:hypothetical protein